MLAKRPELCGPGLSEVQHPFTVSQCLYFITSLHAQYRVRRARLDIPELACGLQFRVSANYTDQRTIGEELMPGSPFETSQVSGRVAASYHDATSLAAISENAKGADLNGPFGSFPAYTVLDQLNFNDAGETTIVVGAAYDFSRIITDGLKFQMRYGKGFNVIEPTTGASQSRQNEINFEAEYQPMSGPFENLHVQLF
jgi:outer membrane porin, OprD family